MRLKQCKMKIIEILRHVPPVLLREVERHINEIGAGRKLAKSVRLSDDILALADETVPRYSQGRGFFTETLDAHGRKLNVIEKIIVAILLKKAACIRRCDLRRKNSERSAEPRRPLSKRDPEAYRRLIRTMFETPEKPEVELSFEELPYSPKRPKPLQRRFRRGSPEALKRGRAFKKRLDCWLDETLIGRPSHSRGFRRRFDL